jgi:hypothetical protein
MSGKLERLEELRAFFGDAIKEAFEAAYAIDEPAGRSEAWAALCARYGIELIDDGEREQVIRAQRPLRGAPVMEFGPLVTELCRQTRGALRQIGVVDGYPETETLYNRLYNLLGRTDQELLAAYRQAVLPKSGGMFANVFASAAAPQASGPSAYSLRCQNCGAPRLSKQDFICGFCDQHMVGGETA